MRHTNKLCTIVKEYFWTFFHHSETSRQTYPLIFLLCLVLREECWHLLWENVVVPYTCSFITQFILLLDMVLVVRWIVHQTQSVMQLQWYKIIWRYDFFFQKMNASSFVSNERTYSSEQRWRQNNHNISFVYVEWRGLERALPHTLPLVIWTRPVETFGHASVIKTFP